MRSTDICIVGGGAAGTLAAHALGSCGIPVILVDPNDRYPRTFQAEKLEPDQVALLGDLGLADRLATFARPIQRVRVFSRGRVVRDHSIEQFGFHFRELIDAMRADLPASVRHVRARVTRVESGADRQRVVLDGDGEAIESRLVVLASGINGMLSRALGVPLEMHREAHSVVLGFTLRSARERLPSDGVNFRPDNRRDRIDYLTLFPTADGIRANLFTYADPDSPYVRELRAQPLACLARAFTDFVDVVGHCELEGRVEAARIDLWTADPSALEGVVLMGDALQSVCPSTGTGLSKVLADVCTLRRMAPQWLSLPSRPATVLDTFYADPVRRAVAADSLAEAQYRRRLVTDDSLGMRLHRAKLALRQEIRGLRGRLGGRGSGVEAIQRA